MEQEHGAIRFLAAAFGAAMLVLTAVIVVGFPSFYGAPAEDVPPEELTSCAVPSATKELSGSPAAGIEPSS